MQIIHFWTDEEAQEIADKHTVLFTLLENPNLRNDISRRYIPQASKQDPLDQGSPAPSRNDKDYRTQSIEPPQAQEPSPPRPQVQESFFPLAQEIPPPRLQAPELPWLDAKPTSSQVIV